MQHFYNFNAMHDELRYNIAEFFYINRLESGLTLREAAQQSGLSPQRIDEIETGLGSFDFADLIRLLELYQDKLNFTKDCFPGLPPDYYQRYFAA